MKQCVAASADQFSAIPGQESPTRQTHLCRMRHPAQANGTPILLVENDPAKPEEAHGERGDELDVLRADRVRGGVPVGQIERAEVDRGQQEGDLGAEEQPAEDAIVQDGGTNRIGSRLTTPM